MTNCSLCNTCKQADVSCPIYPQITQTCVEYRKDIGVKTPAEIEELKRQWRYDPCWDIETTVGFEAHAEELAKYHTDMVAIWAFEAEECSKARAIEIGTSDNPALTETIVRMQNRIESLMERVEKLEKSAKLSMQYRKAGL